MSWFGVLRSENQAAVAHLSASKVRLDLEPLQDIEGLRVQAFPSELPAHPGRQGMSVDSAGDDIYRQFSV